MRQASFGFHALLYDNFSGRIATAKQAREKHRPILREHVRNQDLEAWFQQEAQTRLAVLKAGASKKEIQAALELPNRFPDGSMEPIGLEQLFQMSTLCIAPQDILDRAQQGVELLKNNPQSSGLGTAARGIPGGGASSRAAEWASQNAETAALFGFDETTPRPLYRVGPKTLFQHTLDMSQVIARALGVVFPNLAMTNSENVDQFLAVIKGEFGNWTSEELDNTVLFNQVVLPRIWVEGGEVIEGKLYPAGHGDYPYLLALYNMAKTLHESGIRYLVFSNADEWLWQADPVMISIAQEMFDRGHHMTIVGVENINNQFGGGFVRNSDGSQSLVETPRLPWAVMQSGQAPVALNTTFYICDVAYMAENEAAMLDVPKSLVVKDFPGRAAGTIEQVIGVDSWAGDVFAQVLNPAFIQWPRLNFLGIKDGSFIAGANPVEGIGGRTYLHYVHETVAVFPQIMAGLIEGNRAVAEFLHRTGYSYLEPELL